MNSVPQLDELIKEYLLFRGFINTFRAFEQESRTDKEKSFQGDKIIDELFSYILNSDINGLLEYWRYLDIRYFSRLDGRFFGSVKKFETCLLRYYLVHAAQHKRKDVIFEFFDTFGGELNGNPDWTKWFGFPFSKNPAADSNFETFFTKQWLETFTVSLHNFLNTIFQNMPLPSLLCFNIDRLHRRALQNEIEELQSVVENLKLEIQDGDHEISSLKQKVAQTHSELATGSKSRRRALSLVEQKENTNEVEQLLTPPRARAQVSTSLPVSRSATPINKLETGSDNKYSQSPKSLPEERAISPISEFTIDGEEEGELRNGDETEPFNVTSQELYLEHASGISLAKFSSEGNLIASCDVDNIVRIWSYTGETAASKITNSDYNVLSMEWEARSDKFLLLGTDDRFIRVYNQETKSIVHEFQMEDRFPRVNQVCCSPVESIFACSGIPKKRDTSSSFLADTASGSLVSWNMKTMSIQDTFVLDPSSSSSSKNPSNLIQTIKFNHNGQMLVAGDKAGYIRIFDIRTLSPIMKWNLSSATLTPNKAGSGIICSALFSFDENSIYVVDEAGKLTQWSVLKPGQLVAQSKLFGFPPSISAPPPVVPPASTTATSHTISFQFPTTFRKRTASAASNRSTQSLPTIVIGNDKTPPMSPSSVPMIGFSPDTEHMICVGGTGGCQGVIYQTSNGDQVQHLASHSQYLTSVDWTTTTGNAILTASIDGTLRITKISKSSTPNVNN
ncbi:hypothetical protein G9A89_019109 [Geosiphon pyriformis]|nr:hypothetical protein G9A89_019109 [Geosiphon pyriformis]